MSIIYALSSSYCPFYRRLRSSSSSYSSEELRFECANILANILQISPSLFMASLIQYDERDLETGLPPTPTSQNLLTEPSRSMPTVVVSNSGNRVDRAGLKKYVKQVTGRYNDTELHRAANCGDLAAVKKILNEVGSQMVGTQVNEVNEQGETALFAAADKGFVEIVKELLKYSNQETVLMKNNMGFDPLHIAALQGHHAVVQALLDHNPELSKTIGPSNSTPLISAAIRGHTEVFNELLSKDCAMLEISRSNGKNALHLAARHGHVEIVRALLDKDPQLARRTDKKGQTALHSAVKGQSVELVKLILEADAAIVMLPDKFGNTPLHVATRKIRPEIVSELLLSPDTNVNALTIDHKTPLDIAEEFPPSKASTDIKETLYRYGAVRANELDQSTDELRKAVAQIKTDLHAQLDQITTANKNLRDVSRQLRKLRRQGTNNAAKSLTDVAVFFATVTFAAIFTVPGGDNDDGTAAMAATAPFKIFFVFNGVALFTSLGVVVVQITAARGESRVAKVVGKLMWVASVSISVAFVASAYIVVGRKHPWAAIVVTCVGGLIMAVVLVAVTHYVMRSKSVRSARKKQKQHEKIS